MQSTQGIGNCKKNAKFYHVHNVQLTMTFNDDVNWHFYIHIYNLKLVTIRCLFIIIIF